MKKLFLSLAACAAIFGASARATWQLDTTNYSVDTVYHFTSGPGMTTTALRLEGLDAGVNDKIKNNVFYTTIDLTNPDLELRGVQAWDHSDKVETVKSMGERKNKQGNGQYIAGVNGDFFNMNASHTRTNGHSLVDGHLYNPANGGDWWNTWATYALVEGSKDLRLVQNIAAARTINFPGGNSHKFFINSGRWDNYLVVYTDANDSTGTNQWGAECTMKLAEGSLENNDAVFEITSDVVTGVGNMEIPKGNYVLSGTGDAKPMVEQLKVGDRVSMGVSVKMNGKEINPTQIIGGCTYIVLNGEVAPEKYFSANIIDHFVNNQARTVIGYNKDRTKLIMLVVDKFTTNKYTEGEYAQFRASTGFAMKRMAQLMVNLGCYTAMNFDGGGSAQLYNKELGIRNVPYGEDGYLRPVANGFFAVSNTPVDNEIASIEVREKNVDIATGESFTPTVYGYNKYGVLVNTDVQNYTLTVAPSLGSVSQPGSRSGENAFTAADAKGTTIAVVELIPESVDATPIKCGIRLSTNGGGEYVTSGDDNAPLMVGESYESDEPLGMDKDPIFLTEQWHFVNEAYNDGWDGTVPNWDSEDAIKAKNCIRFATARNGRFYTVDMKTMSIAQIDPEGNLVPLYKLPSLAGREINGVPDYYGCAISSDDAGNFLIGHLFTKTDTYRIWTIYSPKTGKAKHFDLVLPTGEGSNGRIDNVGRVIGDLTRNAYVYVAPKATGVLETNKALIIHFEGDGDVDNVTATPTMSKGLYLAGNGNTGSTIQPKYTSIDEMKDVDINESFYWYSKAAGIADNTYDLFTYVDGDFSTNYCRGWNNYSPLNGFDTFTLAGKRYFVVGYASNSTMASSQQIIIMDEKSNKVAEWNNPDYTSGAGYLTITAIPVSENQVNIYLYNCTGNFAGKGNGNGAIAGALLTLTYGDKYTAYEAADITPRGLVFDNYNDGDLFKLTASESDYGWSAPAGMYHGKNPNAFQENGQLTVFVDRGAALSYNSQDYIDSKVQPAYVVRKLNDYVGNVLAITQPWSPAASRYSWASAGSAGGQAQLNFYVPSDEIKADAETRHYVRVRMVYNVLQRGCHYAMDVRDNKLRPTVASIYTSHENNWVIPVDDHITGGTYAETGINFAQWVDEAGTNDDIPAYPEVYVPADDDADPWDPGHHSNGCMNDPNIKPAYLLNDQRYRVYEFDTYIDNPSKATVSVQFNMTNRNTTFLIKDITFTDLGTDEAAATLLNKRKLGWMYFNASTTGIEDIVTGEEVDSADAPAVYYNLQGVEIKNPENGIYIVRRGNKVTKELIR